MLLHLVSFKYKPATDAAMRAQHRERLAALTGLDGVVDLKVGEDVVGSPRSYGWRCDLRSCPSTSC